MALLLGFCLGYLYGKNTEAINTYIKDTIKELKNKD